MTETEKIEKRRAYQREYYKKVCLYRQSDYGTESKQVPQDTLHLHPWKAFYQVNPDLALLPIQLPYHP
jgi:hypothetical protein